MGKFDREHVDRLLNRDRDDRQKSAAAARETKASLYLAWVAGAALPLYFEWHWLTQNARTQGRAEGDIVWTLALLFVFNAMAIGFAVLCTLRWLVEQFERRERSLERSLEEEHLPRRPIGAWRLLRRFERWRGHEILGYEWLLVGLLLAGLLHALGLW